jgi:putative ATP-dependent endonuclease of the OLD family
VYISKLILRHFRSVKYACIDFKPGKNIVIGKNNSGKSNIVKALDILFGERWPASFEFIESDYHFCKNESRRYDSLYIVAKIEGDDIDEIKLRSVKGIFVYSYDVGESPFEIQDGLIEINKSYVFDEIEGKVRYPEYLQKGGRQYYKRGNENYNRLIGDLLRSRAFYFVFGSEFIPSNSSSKGELRLIFTTNDGKSHICWGFDNHFREAFINSAVMPANRDLHSQTRINNWTWYGKLLRKIWDARKEDPEIKDKLERALGEIRSAGEPVFTELSTQLNDKIKFGFKNARVNLQFVGTSGPDMHKQVQIYVDDGIDDNISRKGSGIQSAVVIGLFTYYCSYNHNTSVLVIEEPEVFLHPQARRSISRRMDEFVFQKQDIGKQNQVILTTHSAEMLQVGQISTITVVRKELNGTETKTLDISGPSILDSSMKAMLKGFPSEMFFADRVVLTEGSEHIMIPTIYDNVKGESGKFDEENYSSVEVGGKGSFYGFVIALKAIGIPYIIISDFDFIDNSLLNFLRNFTGTEEIQQRLANFHNLITKSHGDMKKFLSNSCLDTLTGEELDSAKYIIEYMKDNYNIWILGRGCLEDYLTEKGRVELTSERKKKVVDHKLASVCRSDSEDIKEYIDVSEFESALLRFNF